MGSGVGALAAEELQDTECIGQLQASRHLGVTVSYRACTVADHGSLATQPASSKRVRFIAAFFFIVFIASL